MRITRIYATADGESHFDEFDVSLHDSGDIGRLSEALPATRVIFRENDGDYDFDWHHAPARQYIVLIDGRIEIEVSDGEVRQFSGGDILFVEDTSGRGHRSRSVDGRPRRSVFIQVGDGVHRPPSTNS